MTSPHKRMLNLKLTGHSADDFKYKQIMRLDRKAAALPAKVSWMGSKIMPAPYDQYQWGSCTGNAGERMKYWVDARYGKFNTGSRRALYNLELKDQGTPGQDAGSSLRQTCLTLINHGIPPEKDWAYGPADMPAREFFEPIPDSVLVKAAEHKGDAFFAVNGELQQKTCLAAGYLWIFGINVPMSFMDQTGSFARTGVFKMPKRSETIEGGHALVSTGYQIIDGKLYWEVPNSWGIDIFKGGVMMLPDEFLQDPHWASDFYTLRLAHEKAFGLPEQVA